MFLFAKNVIVGIVHKFYSNKLHRVFCHLLCLSWDYPDIWDQLLAWLWIELSRMAVWVSYGCHNKVFWMWWTIFQMVESKTPLINFSVRKLACRHSFQFRYSINFFFSELILEYLIFGILTCFPIRYVMSFEFYWNSD